MSLEDDIHLCAIKSAQRPPRKKLLLFFITGNPGLIEYYRTYLTSLYDILRANNPSIDYHVYGASLLGFEVSDTHPSKESLSADRSPPFGLQEQIDGVVRRLMGTVKRLNNTNESSSEQPVQVVVLGHSVGAYMLLEVISRWREMSPYMRAATKIEIVGGICLFPTVVDIAKSPTGKMAAPLLKVPYFPLIIHILAKLLTTFIPMFIFVRLVQLITSMPYDGASTTAAFVKSKHGVRQALHMARDEMLEISHDRWSDEFWGVPELQAVATAAATTTDVNATQRRSPSGSNGTALRGEVEMKSAPKLYFYWGRDDHWVANSTRDAVIATRARETKGEVIERSRPFMEIAANDVPHAFCIRHSEAIARKCADYVRDLEGGS